MQKNDPWVPEAESLDASWAQDPRFAGLLPPETPPDSRHICHWYFAGDAYQLVEGLVRTHEDLVDDMVDYLWNVGDRPARDRFGSFEELRDAYWEASNRNGPRRLLEALIARYPTQARVILAQLPKLDEWEIEAQLDGGITDWRARDFSAETKRLTMIARQSRRLRRCVALCRGSRRRGAGRPGHRGRSRANAPPSDDDDPAEPEPDHPAAWRPQRRAACWWRAGR